jgi:glycerophosphoryl diester phosphodiesterase
MSERPFSQTRSQMASAAGHGAHRTMIVAHRGASAVEAENTLPAFEAALAAGADAVEFDVRLSAEGVPVVMHDPDVSRTTDGAGLVRDMTLAQLKRLSIRTTGGASTEVPTLAEALACLSGRALADIEVKNIPGEPDFEPDRERVVEAIISALVGSPGTESVLLSSFNPFSLSRSRELAPGVLTGLLTAEGVDARAAVGFARERGDAWVLPFVGEVLDAGESFIEEAHAAGLLVGTWIVDDPDRAVALMLKGIDAVATNDPARIVAARRSALG